MGACFSVCVSWIFFFRLFEVGKKNIFLNSGFTALRLVHKHNYKCLALTFSGCISLSSWPGAVRGPLTVFICGIWLFRRCTERTCALTLICLSFTMMLSCEFNYFGLQIKAVYLVATLRSEPAQGHNGSTKDTIHTRIHIGCSIKTNGIYQREKVVFSNEHTRGGRPHPHSFGLCCLFNGLSADSFWTTALRDVILKGAALLSPWHISLCPHSDIHSFLLSHQRHSLGWTKVIHWVVYMYILAWKKVRGCYGNIVTLLI